MTIRAFETAFTPLQVFSALSQRTGCVFLDSAQDHHPMSRYSYVMADPILSVTAKNGVIKIDDTIVSEPDIFALLRRVLKDHNWKTDLPENLPPFTGGLAGYFGYDLGRQLERLPEIAADNPAQPDLVIGLYDKIFAFDHEQNKGWFITHGDTPENDFIDFLGHVAAAETLEENPQFAPLWRANFSREDYEAQLEKLIAYICAGDIFQANLTQRFEAPVPQGFNPAAHYLKLRRVNAAPFAGYMDAGSVQLCSASPERFLTVSQNGDVETCPIKGTRPHGKNPVEDAAIRAELLASEKERSENTMIVDLLRNDISKSCTDESVDVTGLCELQTFASVHHLVSTIRGKLRPDKDALDLLKGCFPGGSITGAPKIRAMEIIEELERGRRGPYCGVMGTIGHDGAMDTNILIRTIIFEGGKMSFQVGGGIVADSIPSAEYQETLDKAASIFRSFE